MFIHVKVSQQILFEQTFTEQGCDNRVPQVMHDNIIEFCGEGYPCDSPYLQYINCGSLPYGCDECNGPCLCWVEGLEYPTDPTVGHYNRLALINPQGVYYALEGVKQWDFQWYGYDPEYGDSVSGAYHLSFIVEGDPDLDPYYYYDFEMDPGFLSAIDVLGDEYRLASTDDEETFLRKLRGATAVAASPTGVVTAADHYYLQAYVLVWWQYAYTVWRKGWDWRTPMNYGFPDWYPSGWMLNQLYDIITSSCSQPYFSWAGCTPTANQPTTWGSIKCIHR